jgi:pSer/pThr/pTyr-binding forkhead associated (FHA) protein
MEPVGAVEDNEPTQAVAPAPGRSYDDIGRFMVLNTVFAGTVLPFDLTEMVIGRTEENDLVIQHKSVSRSHAKVVRDGAGFRIEDMGSANGILVNGAEVESAPLGEGDVVELGRVELRYVPAGVSFELSADEIERARVADTTGEIDDRPTHVTSPSRPGLPKEKKGPPVALIGAGAVGLVIVILLVVLLGGGDDDATADPGDDPVQVDTPTPTPPAANLPPPADPKAAAKLEEAERHFRAGDYEAAKRSAEDAKVLEDTPTTQAFLAKVNAAQKAEFQMRDARGYFDEGRYGDAIEKLDAIPADAPQAADAKALRERAYGKQVEALVTAAQGAHDKGKTAARDKAVADLAALDADRAAALKSKFAMEDDDGSVDDPPDDPDPGPTVRPTKRPTKRPPKKPPAAEMSPAEKAAKLRELEAQATKQLFSGKVGGAIRSLREALAIDPKRASVHKQLGLAYERQKKSSLAVKHLKAYLRLSPGAQDKAVIRGKIDSLSK